MTDPPGGTMLRDLMLNAYHARRKSIKTNYRLALDGHSTDGVHDLRVDIKRMRAMFDMVEALSSDFPAKKKFKPFRRIAKKTSVLRDAQVQLELLASLAETYSRDTVEYASFLREREEEGWQTFRQFADTGSPLKKLKPVDRVMVSAVESINDTIAATHAQGRFYNLKNELIILSGRGSLSEEVLHDLRKLAKTVHYTLEIIGPAFPGFTDADAFTGAIKTLHHELGKWHDYSVSLRYLQDFLSTHGIDLETGQYTALAAELRRINKENCDKLPDAFNAFNKVAAQI